MKTAHSSQPSFGTVVLVVSLLILASSTAVALVAAQNQGNCPPIIASLFPKGSSIISGQYFPADLGQGDGSADLSFDDSICPKRRFSARITVTVKNYGGETAILIKSKESPYGSVDRDTDKAQYIENATRELARTRIASKTEKLGIGNIVYVERKTECPPEGPATTAARVGAMIVPEIKLRGVAWAGNATVQVKLEGTISVELAKAAVAEVFANLQKADFSKAK